jgi:hypothetical protein
MLEVNLDQPDNEITEFVAGQCSKLGAVVSVAIGRHPSPAARIEMADHMQSLALAIQFRGIATGGCVLIRLEHKPGNANSTQKRTRAVVSVDCPFTRKNMPSSALA